MRFSIDEGIFNDNGSSHICFNVILTIYFLKCGLRNLAGTVAGRYPLNIFFFQVRAIFFTRPRFSFNKWNPPMTR